MAETIHIGALRPDPSNARKHNPRNIGMIEDALHEVGAARSIVIDESNTILAGNGVIEAAAQAGIERIQVVDTDGETIVAVRRSNLSPAQKQRLALWDNRAAETAEWDTTVLANMLEQDSKALEGMFAKNEIKELLAADEEPYSREIKAPIYEPTGVKPSISDLFDDSHTKALLSEIALADDLSDEERQFLTIAAQRHTILRFDRIAEYYAQSPQPLQSLMEHSALVIIDFQQAIERGYIQLSEAIAQQVEDEYRE